MCLGKFIGIYDVISNRTISGISGFLDKMNNTSQLPRGQKTDFMYDIPL